MRLRKLKLAGFKSFVDPTTVVLPSDLVGVVGPNGCGKSNIIDAVRWVMGESSAKHLRGDSMADVIFNGSSTRKPVGQAMIELVFDNSEGRLGGEYAQYNEISVKRTVSRDGQSHYYLNGTRCRRKDITDVFLGTGLGPRSYAIIEQGTISRIIEAKPEELRTFIEEAAGISKYKERRRETENRIRHTRENLDRLNDLREELGKQLNHLQRQAKTAEKYKVLREEERLLRGQLQTLRWQGLNTQGEQIETKQREQETALEAAIAKQRNIESDIEKQREAHTEANDNFNQVQGRFYSVGSDIARIEQTIQHSRERRQQQNQDLQQLEKDWQEAQSHLETDRQKVSELENGLQEIGPALAQAQEGESRSVSALEEAEMGMATWQTAWEDLTHKLAEANRTVDVQKARSQHLEQHIAQLQQRRQKTSEDLANHDYTEMELQLEQKQQALIETEQNLQAKQEQARSVQSRIIELRESSHNLTADLDASRLKLQELRGRNTSLEALQQVALGKQHEGISEWLASRQLNDAPRLVEKLDVETGWERAVECVLGGYLEAVCVNGFDAISESLTGLTEGTITFFDTGVEPHSSGSGKANRLLDKVKAPWHLEGMLEGVYVSNNLQDAMAIRNNLAAHESVVTQDGFWLGAGWLRVTHSSDEKAGILQREQELKSLAQEIEQVTAQVESLQENLSNSRELLRELEAQSETAQSDLNQANRAHAESQGELNALQARLEQVKSRQNDLQRELEELSKQIENEQSELDNAGSSSETAQQEVSLLSQQRVEMANQREELRNALDEARESAHTDREAAHQVRLRSETLRTELTSTRQALQRMEAQLQQLTSRRDELQRYLAEGETPIQGLETELAQKLEQRIAVEAELARARSNLEDLEHRLRGLDEARSQAEQAVQVVRSELEQIRIGAQELKVRRQTIEEKINESGFELKTLIEQMPEHAEESSWVSQVEDMEKRIQRLGPINLAAIDEFDQQSERKKYLDAQNDDLTEALTTLENAIAKIDRETRTRFKETYDKVNTGFQSIFPRLFGGGHAYLEMTGDDLLETGITVMARPPGKRNSTIHLLSGGEKALTAVAMVFSIFELNPAPFCMLDEVDAPLDDANVGRYCDMLREMSGRTQFIFITHNKVTMEVAQHLTGVTMHEPGCSRLVAVDVDEAVKLAAV
ncbi:MAG: chromosome segregation protein SMC [Gammaproteobacteria bacterium]|nr:chromosome segregation protein SMC [Gammaproteobacteria bacterium]MDH5652201.1 chromosome segregation protein SMC [Gammaproteobacteria bacterium]